MISQTKMRIICPKRIISCWFRLPLRCRRSVAFAYTYIHIYILAVPPEKWPRFLSRARGILDATASQQSCTLATALSFPAIGGIPRRSVVSRFSRGRFPSSPLVTHVQVQPARGNPITQLRHERVRNSAVRCGATWRDHEDRADPTEQRNPWESRATRIADIRFALFVPPLDKLPPASLAIRSRARAHAN